MKRNTLLMLSPAFIILCYSTLASTQGTNTQWSQWACFNDTVATRSRTVQNCTDMEFTDPVTNMTTTNTSCDDVMEIDTRTNVVSMVTWTSWSPVVQCSANRMITQTRIRSCDIADPQCSSNCEGSRTFERTMSFPLCCAQQNFSDWTSWAPGCSPSAPVQQTRERIHIPCNQNIQCEPDCYNMAEMRIIAQTSWGAWGAWSSTEVPMCENGQRSRQRMCINTTVVFCDIDCTFGNIIDDFQCCVEPNTWSTWSTWGQPTTTGRCPVTRTRTRICMMDTSVDTSLPTCDGICVLDGISQDMEEVDTARCDATGTLATTTGTLATTTDDDSGFPIWAIVVISAVGVVLVLGGFIAIAIIRQYITRRSTYSPGEADQKQYGQMNEGAPTSTYQPTVTFAYNQEGVPGTAATDSLKYAEPYDEQQF